MGIKDTLIKSASQFLSNISGGRFQFYQQSDVVGTDRYDFGTNSDDYINKAYGGNPYVFMVINRIVERAVDLDFTIVDDSLEEVTTVDPFFNSILTDPNKEGLKSSIFRMLSNFLVKECFVVETVAFGMESITGFIVPNANDVLINTDSKGYVVNYSVSYLGRTEILPVDSVLHIKRPDITTQLNNGISPLKAGRKVYESNNEVWSSEASIHKNKGIAGILSSGSNNPMQNKEQKALQDHYDKANTGSKNFGKIKVSTEQLSYIPMGMNPNDLKSIETRIDHLRAICALYNVDPRLFGDVSASTYNNMRESKAGLIIDAVLPLLNKVMPELFSWINSKTNTEYLYMADIKSIPEMQVYKEIESARVGREVMQGIITKDQALTMLYPELVTESLVMESIEGMEGFDSEAEDVNAEAQARLRGSVGGVQGILQIQASVQAGVTPRDSAVIILMEIFGFEEQTANEILG